MSGRDIVFEHRGEQLIGRAPLIPDIGRLRESYLSAVGMLRTDTGLVDDAPVDHHRTFVCSAAIVGVVWPTPLVRHSHWAYATIAEYGSQIADRLLRDNLATQDEIVRLALDIVRQFNDLIPTESEVSEAQNPTVETSEVSIRS